MADNILSLPARLDDLPVGTAFEAASGWKRVIVLGEDAKGRFCVVSNTQDEDWHTNILLTYLEGLLRGDFDEDD